MKKGRENDKGTNYYNYPRTIRTLNCIPSGNACPGEMPRGESVVPASVERLRGEDCSASDLCDDPTEWSIEIEKEKERRERQVDLCIQNTDMHRTNHQRTYVGLTSCIKFTDVYPNGGFSPMLRSQVGWRPRLPFCSLEEPCLLYLVVFLVGLMVGLTVIEKGRLEDTFQQRG